MQTLPRILFIIFVSFPATACIWDAQSLSREKSRSHDLAQTILGASRPIEDSAKLQNRIQQLEANRQENDPAWWNNLAGAYLRLGQPEKAIKLLEPVLTKFPDDYGIHANLGTAYHLMDRYQDAKKEIARDLEINPNAHFGLEKYHLALLQYLVRDPKYQSRHVYVDEFTYGFLEAYQGGHLFIPNSAEGPLKASTEDFSNELAVAEADYAALLKTNNGDYRVAEALSLLSSLDPFPPYRTNWNLASDSNFEAGVIYMAQMNPKEPACSTMLGIAAWQKRDYHLAVTAFEKAIALGSPQSQLLQQRINGLRHYIEQSHRNDITPFVESAFLIFFALLGLSIYLEIRSRLRASRKISSQI